MHGEAVLATRYGVGHERPSQRLMKDKGGAGFRWQGVGLILHEVFSTFLARPQGLLQLLFLPDWLFQITSDGGYLKAPPVWAHRPTD